MKGLAVGHHSDGVTGVRSRNDTIGMASYVRSENNPRNDWTAGVQFNE